MNGALPFNSELYDLKGLELIWNIVLNGNDKVAQRAISALCNIYAASFLSTKVDPVKLRVDFVNKCYVFLSESCSKVRSPRLWLLYHL